MEEDNQATSGMPTTDENVENAPAMEQESPAEAPAAGTEPVEGAEMPAETPAEEPAEEVDMGVPEQSAESPAEEMASEEPQKKGFFARLFGG